MSRRPWWKPRRSRRAQRWAFAIVATSLTIAAVAAHGAYERLIDYPERPGQNGDRVISLEVPRGSSFQLVLKLLVEHEVLAADEAVYFKLFVLHKGAAGRVTAGDHSFRGDMTPTEILEELMRKQRAEEVRVTVPEGKTMLDVAQILADAGLGTFEENAASMRDPALREELGIEGPTLEGYLFPDTYKFKRKSKPADALRRMVARHRAVYKELRRRYRHAAADLDKRLEWGSKEIVTLASIVEKETGAAHERPLIAGVFLNRLRFLSFKPKLLQTDPTIIYGCTVPVEKSPACQKFEDRIRTIHLRDEQNPYNTYTHEGLPPGPIANPGRAALEAVFAPKKSRFLYFVSRNDGTHVFSKNRREHEENVDVYQRKGKVGG